MTAPVFNLAAARTNTPNWPPLDQDVWVDRNGNQWMTHRFEINDEIRTAFLGLDTRQRATPDYLLETAGPLSLVTAGWERVRDQRASAVAA